MKTCPICLSAVDSVLFQVPGATISNCSRCSHSFSHDLSVTPSEIYNADYFHRHHKNWFEHPNYMLFHRIYEMCQIQFHSKDISILDVGCGNGDFLNYLYSMGFTHLTGVDFTSNHHESIQFIQKNLFNLSEEDFPHKFDLIVSLATIEHVEDVHQFIKILSSLTRSTGILCLMTIDSDSLIYQMSRFATKFGISHGVNRLYDPHHLNHFSRKSFKKLIELCGDYKILEHYGINFPYAAIDLPKSAFNFVLKPAVKSAFFLTSLIEKFEFLQVITVRKK